MLQADQGRGSCGTGWPWAPPSLPAASQAEGTGSYTSHLLGGEWEASWVIQLFWSVTLSSKGGGASTKGHQTCSCSMGGLLGPCWGYGPSVTSRLHHSGLGPQHSRPQGDHSYEVGTGKTLH